MSQPAASSSIPESVRLTGIAVLILGVLAVARIAFSALAQHVDMDVEARAAGLAGALVKFHHQYLPRPIAIAWPVWAAAFGVAGVMLARGREWGRRALIALLWLWIAWRSYQAVVSACMPFAFRFAGDGGGWGRMMAVAGAVVTAALSAALAYLAIRWLSGPTVREACARPAVVPSGS